MLISHRQYSKLPWLGFLIVGLLLLGYGLSRSSSYQTCEANHHAYSAYQEDQDGPFALKWVWRNAKVKVRCTLDFVERNHAELTAVGTIALAIFTTSLWLATRSLVRHAPQIERAYISAGGFRRFVSQPTNVPGQYVLADTQQFEFHINNYGRTKGEYSNSGGVSAKAPTSPMSSLSIKPSTLEATSIRAHRAYRLKKSRSRETLSTQPYMGGFITKRFSVIASLLASCTEFQRGPVTASPSSRPIPAIQTTGKKANAPSAATVRRSHD